MYPIINPAHDIAIGIARAVPDRMTDNAPTMLFIAGHLLLG
ncbi:hypothetical protein [Novacetimonas hansenii]|uniref:Uncharacterized protein n=1 Tax=Novacetimonas hansenii ATCC 23769 TaxID=714995 RepID=D5QHQ9_NOVHA|nr:hypothetical protein [Novacetimonas hansenii]EFG83384.1 hypothetical protein GXY_13438 [Novacetimonas hansenii ATCC 23769]WEQ58841.1 hypothetical protein LV563_13685 [Novacetimonas hansenii]